MNRFNTCYGIAIALLLVIGLPVHGQAFKDALAPLVEASCIDCHDADTDTPLNFKRLGMTYLMPHLSTMGKDL